MTPLLRSAAIGCWTWRGGQRALRAGGMPKPCPSPDNHFDCITIAFGLRNVTHKDRAIASMLRVLKPGGRLLVLEFSKPGNKLLSKAYDQYSFACCR